MDKQPTPFPPVTHRHMPVHDTTRMKALKRKREALLAQIQTLDDELQMLTEQEQHKALAHFRHLIEAEALHATAPLDFGDDPAVVFGLVEARKRRTTGNRHG